MAAMTMTYTVKDGRQLANLQPLQKVEFELTYDGKIT
jgi:Cu/Ag efflux protein CusF